MNKMLEQPKSESDDFLAADADDPRLSVHGLSEFAFCPRAGLCLYEQDFEDGQPEAEADLYFLPIHEPQELQLVLETLMRQFMWILFGGLGVFVLLLGGAWYVGWVSLWLAPVAVLLLTVWGLYDRGYWVYKAQQHLEMWRQAKPEMPDPDSPKIQDVDWRNLIASEATIVRPPAAYEDPAWKLGARPWRILEYGDLRIPVFNHRTPWKDLFHQHVVRMAAYCHLLEITEGAESPYGVIVKGKTFAAVTVPNTSRTRAVFREALIAARRTIRESEEINACPPEPGNEGICRDCHFGWPIRLQGEERFLRHGAPIEPKAVKDEKKTKYHSHCGDRFRWLPQHRGAVAMDLSEQ
jgi:CRISPR/Cas system-associated exonuclease Cas4 (RecB family)